VSFNADNTLVIITDSNCHYSRDSILFHQSLVRQAVQLGIASMLVSPPKRTPKELLSVAFTKHVEIDLTTIKAPGTPSVALVSRSARIVGLWVGQLGKSEQTALLTRLDGDMHTIHSGDRLTGVFPTSMVSHQLGGSLLVDLRARAQFQAQHHPRAINIPLDELQLLMPLYATPGASITLDCSVIESGMCSAAIGMLKDVSYVNVKALDRGASSASCFKGAIR